MRRAILSTLTTVTFLVLALWLVWVIRQNRHLVRERDSLILKNDSLHILILEARRNELP